MHRAFKTHLYLTLAVFTFAMSLSTAMAFTLHPGYGVEATIPFDFNAGDTHLPAGKYLIVRTSTVEPSMELTNEAKNIKVFLLVEDMSEVKDSLPAELVFHKIGDKDFLSGVRTEGDAYQFEQSHQEKQLVMNGSKSQTHKISCNEMMKN